LSAPERKPHKNPSSLNVSEALTGTKRGNGEACSKSDLHLFEGRLPTRGRVWVFCLPPATSAGVGGRKVLCRRSLAVFRRMAPVRVHPPRAGVEAGHPRVSVVEPATHPAAGETMARLGVPPGVALCESTRKLAHSKRFVNAKAPWESKQRMEYGGLPPLCEAGQGETWPPTGVEAGPPKGRNHHELKQGRSGRERQEGHCTRETVAQEGGLASGVPAGEEGSECATVEGRIGVCNSGKERWGVGRWIRAAGKGYVRGSGPASFFDPGQRGGSLGFGDLLAQRAPTPAVPHERPAQPVQKLKCAKKGRICEKGVASKQGGV